MSNRGIRGKGIGDVCGSAESLCGAGFGLRRFLLSIPGRGIGLERTKQMLRDRGNPADGIVEGSFVGLRRLVKAADFSHELQRRGLKFLLRNGWFEIKEGADIAAHC